MRRNNFVIGMFGLIGALMADRVLKCVVSQRLINGVPDTTNGIFQIGYFTNTGIGLGIQLPVWLILGLSTIIIIGLVVWLIKSYAEIIPITRWAIGLILIGAVSNLYDRIYYGHVIDVISILEWSKFNPADVWIVIGVFILAIEMTVNKKTTIKTQPRLNRSIGW